VGGLGNQLHGIAAGVTISGYLRLPVQFDARQIPYGSNPKRVLMVDQLDLGINNFVFKRSKFSPIIGRLLFATNRLGLPMGHLVKGVEPDWIDNESGPENQLPLIPSRGVIAGHFLDFQWAETAFLNGMNLRGLKRPLGLGALEIAREMTPKSIAIHARFGDYKKNLKSFPLLDLHFYQRALEKFDNVADRWIFTDDIRSAGKILGDKFVSKSKLIPLARISDVEAFFLLSRFNQIVTSNSTFSSWAAFFADKNQKARIVTPTPHMFGNWKDNLPNEWIRVEI
jgi:hypothetical protein